MVSKICELKNRFLERIEADISERGIERIDVEEMGELVDMVKDLADAEKECWEAQYYRSIVTESMEKKYGYQPTGRMMDQREGYGSAMGYGQLSRGTGTMGYHDDIVEKLGEEMKRMRPEEQMSFRTRVIEKLNGR